jgi:putative flippase GtrA
MHGRTEGPGRAAEAADTASPGRRPPVPPRFARFLRFGGVGAVATLIQYLILVALVRLAGIDPVTASTTGFVTSAVFNYALNYRFTFASDKPHREAMLKFLVILAGGIALNTLLMALATHVLDLHYIAAQLATTLLVLCWNFLGNEFWTFRRRRSAL